MKKQYTRAELESLLKTAMEKLVEAVRAAQGSVAAHEVTLKNLKQAGVLLEQKNREIESLKEQLTVQEALKQVPPANKYLC